MTTTTIYITNDAAKFVTMKALSDMAAARGCALRVSVSGGLVIDVPAERPVWVDDGEDMQ